MADRDVRVNLQLKVAGDAPAALKDAAGKADALGKSYKTIGSEADKAARSVRTLADESAKVKQPGGGVAGGAMRPAMAGAAPPAMPMGLQKPATQPQGLAGQLGIGQETLQSAAAAGATAFAAITATAKGLSAVAKGLDAFGDETKTANQALRTFAESLPVAGEVFKSLGELSDALSGKSAIIRKLSREDQIKSAEAQGLVTAYQGTLPLKSQQLANEALSGALANTPKFDFGSNAPKRDSLQGDLAYAQYERRSSLEIDQRRANAEREAAQTAAAAATAERKRLQSAIDPLSASNASASAAMPKGLQPTQSPGQASAGDWLKGTLKAAFAGGLDPQAWKTAGTALLGPTAGASFESVDKLKAGGDLKASLQEELKLRTMLTTAAQQEAAAVKAAADAESKARQAAIALAKDELAVLKEKEAQIKASAQSFGGLEAADKQAALEASNRFKQLGGGAAALEQLTPEERAAITGVGGGQVLAFAGQQSAQNDPRYKAIQQNLGLDFDLAANQEKQLQLQSKISLDVQVDTDGLAKTLTESLKPVIEALVKNLSDLVSVQIAQIKVGQSIANASQ